MSNAAVVSDDHELFRSALSELLKGTFGFSSVFQAGSLDEGIEHLGASDAITFASFDLYMPGMEGATSLHSIREIYPKVHLAVVTASERREDILAALGAGVNGFIPKSLGIVEVRQALRSIIGGQIYVPAALAAANALASPAATAKREPVPFRSNELLSPRQNDVLALMAQGLTNKEIARHLRLAEGTVKVHVNALYRALGAHNRVSAVAAMQRLELKPSS